jgi:hypothetical protein
MLGDDHLCKFGLVFEKKLPYFIFCQLNFLGFMGTLQVNKFYGIGNITAEVVETEIPVFIGLGANFQFSDEDSCEFKGCLFVGVVDISPQRLMAVLRLYVKALRK